LHGGDGLHGVRPADGVCAGLRQPEVPDLALDDEVANRPSNVLDRHVRVDPVLIEQVDAAGPQPLQHLLHDLPDVLRRAVQPSGWGELESELRREDDLVANRLEGFTDKGFVGVRPVRLGGVEEGHPQLVRVPDQSNAVVGVDGVTVVGAEAHATESDRRHLQAAELSLVHELPFHRACGALCGVVVLVVRAVRSVLILPGWTGQGHRNLSGRVQSGLAEPALDLRAVLGDLFASHRQSWSDPRPSAGGGIVLPRPLTA
jgi:hypothetical protein